MSSPPDNPFRELPPKPDPYAPPQHYGPPQGGPYPPYPYGQPHRGPLVLTLGITGIVLAAIGWAFCGLMPIVSLALTIPAWVMGQRDLKAISAGVMDPSARGQLQAGMITGIIGTVMGVLALLAMIVGFLFIFGLMLFDAQRGPM